MLPNRIIKYLFTTVITAFATTNCADSSTQKKLAENYEVDTDLKFPRSIIDLACLANKFPSQLKQKQNENNICFEQVWKDYVEIKQIPNLVYDDIDQSFISNTYPRLGIKGIHLKVFERQEDNRTYVFVVIRHQEHESYLTDEMNEMMSLFGPAATVDRQQGNKEVFGAAAVSSMMRFVRQQFGLDYLRQGISMFKIIQQHYQSNPNTKFIFSGFSSGGLYAIILALYFNYPAITFSATGVEDIINIYYSHLFTEKTNNIPPIYNFAHEFDQIPQLDCQLGTLCLYQSNEQDRSQSDIIHINTIFGDDQPHIIQWLEQINRWTCTEANNYNYKYGSCKRERMRWKDRIQSIRNQEL